MQKHVNRISAELLFIDHTQSADVIAEITGLEPSEVIAKGDIKREDPEKLHAPILHKHDVWSYRLNLPENLSLEDALEKAIHILAPCAVGIASVASDSEAELSIYGFAEDADRQAVHLSAQVLKELSGMNLNLDIDVYPSNSQDN